MGLSSLFKKLLGRYGDDAARVIANQGDDVARIVANNADDVGAALVADNAGRAIPSLDLYDDDFLDALESAAYIKPSYESNALGGLEDFEPLFQKHTPQELLKRELQFKRSPAALDVVDIPERPSVVPDGHTFERWGRENVAGRLASYDNQYWGGFPSTTNYLGDVVGDLSEDSLVPSIDSTSIKVPELPTSGLVAQTPKFGDYEEPHVVGLRPHKNTALGKWFSKNLKNYPIHQLVDYEEIF